MWDRIFETAAKAYDGDLQMIDASSRSGRISMAATTETSSSASFNKLKHYRAIATRYEKRAANYLALVKLASIRISG